MDDNFQFYFSKGDGTFTIQTPSTGDHSPSYNVQANNHGLESYGENKEYIYQLQPQHLLELTIAMLKVRLEEIFICWPPLI